MEEAASPYSKSQPSATAWDISKKPVNSSGLLNERGSLSISDTIANTESEEDVNEFGLQIIVF